MNSFLLLFLAIHIFRISSLYIRLQTKMADTPQSHIAADLADRLGVALISANGAKLLPPLFEENKPTCYFTETVHKLEKVIGRTVPDDIIIVLNEGIDCMIKFVKNSYFGKMESGESQKKCYEALYKEVFDDFFPEIVMLARDHFYGILYVNVFIIAAYIHLILLQELIIKDPETSNPYESDIFGILQHDSTCYTYYLKRAEEEIFKKRLDFLTAPVLVEIEGGARDHDRMNCTFVASWQDKLTNYRIEFQAKKINGRWTTDNLEQLEYKTKMAKSEYIVDLFEELHRELNYPKVAMEAYELVSKSPLSQKHPRLQPIDK